MKLEKQKLEYQQMQHLFDTEQELEAMKLEKQEQRKLEYEQLQDLYDTKQELDAMKLELNEKLEKLQLENEQNPEQEIKKEKKRVYFSNTTEVLTFAKRNDPDQDLEQDQDLDLD